jgi:hypothetical protein
MNAVVPKLSFEEQIKNKIRESIGELMTDEDLKKLIDATMGDVLLKERVVQRTNSYGYASSDRCEPLLKEVLTELLKDRVKLSVDDYLKRNENVIRIAVDEAIAGGILRYLVSQIDMKLGSATSDMGQQILRRLGVQV